MRSLTLLETNIRNCLDQIHQLRDENERIRRDAEGAARELMAVRERNVGGDSIKKQVLDSLEALVARIDSLHIDAITND